MSTYKESICLDCIYGSQPHGVYPIICVFSAKHIKEMWHDVFKCKHFDKAPDPVEEVTEPMKPFQIVTL